MQLLEKYEKKLNIKLEYLYIRSQKRIDSVCGICNISLKCCVVILLFMWSKKYSSTWFLLFSWNQLLIHKLYWLKMLLRRLCLSKSNRKSFDFGYSQACIYSIRSSRCLTHRFEVLSNWQWRQKKYETSKRAD